MANPRIKSVSKPELYELAFHLADQSYDPISELEKYYDLRRLRDRILLQLSHDQRFIIESRYPIGGVEECYIIIAKKLEISIDEVRELEKKALKRIKDIPSSSMLESYLHN